VDAAADDASYYLLADAEINARITAAPRRVVGRGKADIGGRMRVAKILRDSSLKVSTTPVRVAGATNEVWQAGDFIIRVGFARGARRLRREARLSRLLPNQVNYPAVVASGVEAFGEWIIVRRISGIPLSEAWAYMDQRARRAAVHELARTIKAVHNVRLTEHQSQVLALKDGYGPLALPHLLPADRIVQCLEEARELPHMDHGLIDDAIDRTRAVAGAFPSTEKHGLIHGDLHFENVLAEANTVVSVIDFEWAREAPRELDIDILARFCWNPQVHVGGDYQLGSKDFRSVLFWWAEAYPEIFEAPNLSDRLMLSSLAFDVPWLLKFPPTGPAATLSAEHPINQLRSLLSKGSYAERIGWLHEYDRYSDL
jgi:aminoglycoside phosphotransferase (APT) family kinase protein